MLALVANLIKSVFSSAIASLAINFRLSIFEISLFAVLAFTSCFFSEWMRTAMEPVSTVHEKFVFTELFFTLVIALRHSHKFPFKLGDYEQFIANLVAVFAVTIEASLRLAVSGHMAAVAFDLIIASVLIGLFAKSYGGWDKALKCQVCVYSAITARLVITEHTHIPHLLVLTAAMLHEIFDEPKLDSDSEEKLETHEPLNA